MPNYLYTALFFLAMLLTSCRGGDRGVKPEEPARLLSKEEMAIAMTELLVLEQQISEAQIQRPAAVDSFNKYQRFILDSLSIDSITYYQNFAYYSAQLEQFEEIVNLSVNALTAERDSSAPSNTQPK